jgi:hypothetical protein
MLLQETMRKITSLIPPNVLVQNGYQPHQSNRPQAVWHGPTTSLGSMNVIHLKTKQAVELTKLMISHLRKEDEIGQMIQTSIDNLQIQAGTS